MIRQSHRSLALSLAAMLATAVLGALVSTPVAQAELSFCPPGSEQGQCLNPLGVATDFETGRVYVADTDNSRVNVFKAETGELIDDFAVSAKPRWIAVDNAPGSPSRHDVYVSDANQKVQKFDSAGNQELGPFGSFDESIRGIGVDGTGTVYVVDMDEKGNCEGDSSKGVEFLKRIQKFNDKAELIGTIEPTDAPCGRITGFAVGSDGSYWLANEEFGEAVRRYPPLAVTAGCEVEEGIETKGLGIDSTGHVFSAQREQQLPSANELLITRFDPACNHLRRFGYGKIEERMFGLAALSTPTGDVIGSEENGALNYLKIPPPGPIVANAQVLSLGATKATVRAQINPEGKATSYHFEYVDETSYEADKEGGGDGFEGPNTKVTPTKSPAIPAEKEFRANVSEDTLLGCAEAAEAEIEAGNCLSPGTEYRWRVVVSNADGDGEGPKEGPELKTKPPLESEVFATGVSTDTATLNTRLNPLGFATEGRFEYVEDSAYEKDKEEGGDGFAEATPQTEIDFGSGEAFLKRSVVLSSLAKGTTYRYRLVARNLFFDAIPSEVKGFTTFPEAKVDPCPANETFRSGAASLLPDCRAYELVSPLDKAGGDIVVLPEETTVRPTVLEQSSVSGDRLAYGSYRAFGDILSASFTSQYIAERTASGWLSHGISPPRGRAIKPKVTLDNEYRRFTPDLCEGILATQAEPTLTEDALPGYINLYTREDELCGGAPDYTAFTTSKPAHTPEFSPTPYRQEAQGISADGQVMAFATTDNLEGSGAPPINLPASAVESQLYVKEVGSEEPPRYACILPGGTPAKVCTAGGGGVFAFGRTRTGSVTGALSADGKRLYWQAADFSNLASKLYLRQNPLGEGAECAGTEAPCTIAVSEDGEALSGTNQSRFWAAAEDGSAAIFSTGNLSDGSSDLYLFTETGEATEKIAGQIYGVAGQSEDLSRIYFASGEAIAGAGQNSEGDEGVEGEPNLYLYEAGIDSYRFVGTVADGIGIGKQSARATASGQALTFMSTAQLTGFDNTDARSPVPCGDAKAICDKQVFVYDAGANGGAGELICASCNPSGARPAGANVSNEIGNDFWIAARLPTYETTFYAPKVLSEDGKRLVFEAADALVPRDTNERLDVYQWERAGTGSCDQADASFSEENNGCIDLISSGQSKRHSAFVDASASGEDIFFVTLSSLLEEDYGLVDIYDARANGGLPPPPPPEPECDGEACQSPPASPEFRSLSTASFKGVGDPKAVSEPRRRSCPKGKRRVRAKSGKQRCAPRRKAKRSNTKGRSAR